MVIPKETFLQILDLAEKHLDDCIITLDNEDELFEYIEKIQKHIENLEYINQAEAKEIAITVVAN